MASSNKTTLPQQQADYEYPTPPPTPTTGTFPNAETIHDQAQDENEVANPASATDASPSEPSPLEQESQEENATQPSEPTVVGTSAKAEGQHDEEDSPVYLPDPFTGLLDNHPVKKDVRPSVDDAFNPFDVKFRPGEGFESGSPNKEEQDFEADFDPSQYRDEDVSSPSDKGKQKEEIQSECPQPSSSATTANPNDTAMDVEDQESGPSGTTNDEIYTPPSYEEFRDTWHNCDQCGNIIRCSFRTPQAQDDDAEVDDRAEAQNEGPEEQPTARGLVFYLARLIVLQFPFFARLFPCAGVEATGGDWNGPTDYDTTVVPPGQGWNVAWNVTSPPTEAGGEIEAPSAAAEEEPLHLLVKYDSCPFPDPSGPNNTGVRGGSYTIVSSVLPSDPYPAVMSKILHRLKGTDGTHNPYPIAPTGQIDYVDIQFGAIAAHAPGFLGRRKIEEENVGDLLKYLRQRTGGDDMLEVFLVPMNEPDAQEHVPKTFEDWMIERVTKGKIGQGIGEGLLYKRLLKEYQKWVAETGSADKDEENVGTVEEKDADAEVRD